MKPEERCPVRDLVKDLSVRMRDDRRRGARILVVANGALPKAPQLPCVQRQQDEPHDNGR